jgi:hypothetical protein
MDKKITKEKEDALLGLLNKVADKATEEEMDVLFGKPEAPGKHCEKCKSMDECHSLILKAFKDLKEIPFEDWPKRKYCEDCKWTTYCLVIGTAIKGSKFYWPGDESSNYPCVARSCFAEMIPGFPEESLYRRKER